MKKLFVLMSVCLLLLCGCGAGKDGKKESGKPEVEVIRMAGQGSGHILTLIADEMGYLRDEGIRVEYTYTQTDAEVFEGIKNGYFDVAATSGTNLPLQKISSGLDLTIFGGYLVTGCMPVISRVETPWNGIEDLIGKTMACEPNLYAITGPLIDMGYDPLNQINWYETVDQNDRIKAVKNGEADFALVGTTLNYSVLNDPEIKVLTYAADILPDYSCCRAEALTSWVNEHPNAVKALIRAWIRALAYAYDHHEETVQLAVRKLGVEEAFVRAYLDNPRFDMNTDPLKQSVIRAWDYMDRLGLLSAEAKTIDIEDHINVDLYKEALDECQIKYGAENPMFYENLQATYARNNG